MSSEAELSDLDRLALKNGPLPPAEADRFKKLSQLQGQLADSLIARFQDNLKAFSKFIPDIAEKFAHYRPSQPLEFFCTENGIPNLMFPSRGGDILYKTDDPLALCRAQLEQALERQRYTGTGYAEEYDPFGQIHFRYLAQAVRTVKAAEQGEGLYSAKDLGSCPNAVIVGIGLGYPLALLCERVEVANLVIIEPDCDLFFAALHAFDWAPFLEYLKENGYGINFLIGQTPRQLTEDLSAFYEHHGRFLTSQCLCLVHYASSEIQGLVQTLLKDYYRIHSAMGFFDDHLFGISHGLYACMHGHSFLRSDVELPEKIRRKVPLFIVGNGPSLDEDIPFLRRSQDKAVIIACGTALDTLYHAGIRPDFYAATERTPGISETIDAIPDQDFKDRLILIAGDVIHPRTQDRFRHTAIFGKPDEPFFWMLAAGTRDGRHVRTVNVMNPIVGNLGVSAGLSLGFERVFLFGLDNGKPLADTGGRMHSKYSALYGSAGVSDKGGNYRADGTDLPGNFGSSVQSNYIFRLANRHMELVITLYESRNKALKVTNCSGGAAMEGAKPRHSSELKEEFSKLPDAPKAEIAKYVCERMSLDFALTHEQAKALCLAPEFLRLCDSLLGNFKARPKTRTALVQLMMKQSETIASMIADPLTRGLGFVLEGSLQSLFMMALNALYHIRDESRAAAAANEVLALACDLIEDAQKLYPNLPDYVLGEHYKFLNGKVGFDHEDSKAPDVHPRPRLIIKPFDDPQKVFVKRFE